jgi:glycosyltransferase involved in cell wall biosynthesis
LGIRKLANALIYIVSLVRTAILIRQRKPDIVHVQGFFGSVLGLITLRTLAHLGGAPIVNTPHNLASRRRYVGEKLVVRWTLPVVRGLVVHSEYGLRQLRKQHPKIAHRVFAIPLGNFLMFGGESTTVSGDSRLRLGLAPNSPVILFFGFIKPYKGLDTLLDAFALVKNQLLRASLLIAGEAKENFDKYSRIIRDRRIEDSTITDIGYIPAERVKEYFAAADVVVLPYKHQRTDTVVVDHSGVAQIAYAFAKPVVASAIGGLAEVIEEGKSGYTVRPDSPDDLAEALLRVLTDPSKATKMGRHGYALATTKYSWDAIASQHLAAYRSTLAGVSKT